MANRVENTTKVKERAAEAAGWSVEEIEVNEVDDLGRAGCTFYRASNPAHLDGATLQYAVLPGGGIADDATEVLRACGEHAPAGWWAEIVGRLGGVRGLVVNEHAPSAIRKIRAAGGDWAPTLETDEAGATVGFYTVDYERRAVFQVKATLPPAGPLTVEQDRLGS